MGGRPLPTPLELVQGHRKDCPYTQRSTDTISGISFAPSLAGVVTAGWAAALRVGTGGGGGGGLCLGVYVEGYSFEVQRAETFTEGQGGTA